jgi:hypothetical protein
MRCRKHYQGDKCTKEKGHDSSLLPQPDRWHVGHHNLWNDQGDHRPLVPPPSIHRRDLRALSAAVTRATSLPSNSEEKRYLLGQVLKYVREVTGR